MQNVVFEHGYLLGKTGRERISALVKGYIELPNDLSGVVYNEMDVAGAWKINIAKEIKEVGYSIDMNKLF
ncbi:nucleotide-binding protein [Clostridium botulinum]|nr:nucleotide-binding protein [Clostridium botulinum]UZP08495.1 nucleotide-binding protein [Clostridium botulinum]UZP11845.1 nucleotide-binding protein [Clostridium botulinum]